MPVLANEWSSFSKVDDNAVTFLFYYLYYRHDSKIKEMSRFQKSTQKPVSYQLILFYLVNSDGFYSAC
jgi:hypothetical protein